MLRARIETALSLSALPVSTASAVLGRFGMSAQPIFAFTFLSEPRGTTTWHRQSTAIYK